MSDHPVMRFDVTCTVWGCPSRMVFLMPVAGTAIQTIELSRKFSHAHGWRVDHVGVLCAMHVPNKVGKLKAMS